jgi:hypothetical protein
MFREGWNRAGPRFRQATTSFHIVDIHQYMIVHSDDFAAIWPKRWRAHLHPRGKKFPARIFLLLGFPLYLISVKVLSLFSHPSASRSLL